MTTAARVMFLIVIGCAAGASWLVFDAARMPGGWADDRPTPTSLPVTSTSSTSATSPASVVEGGAAIREDAGARWGAGLSPSLDDRAPAWDRLADCESGDWDRHGHPITGTARWGDARAPYEGGLHFLPSTWLGYGGAVYAEHAYDASRAEQIAIARRVLADQGPSAWPVCSRKIGAR